MWVSVALETDAAHADALSDALMAAGAISVSVEDALAGTELETPQFGEPDATGGGPATPLWSESRVVALFDPSEDLIGRIAAATVAAGIDDLPEIELEEVAEQDWVRLTQAQFDPIRVNERLWIVPSWHAAPDAAAINLVLDPGRIHCAMQAYAEFRGEWSAEKGQYRWQKLSAAAAQQGVTVTNAHRALGDCLMTLGVVRAMASTENAQGV